MQPEENWQFDERLGIYGFWNVVHIILKQHGGRTAKKSIQRNDCFYNCDREMALPHLFTLARMILEMTTMLRTTIKIENCETKGFVSYNSHFWLLDAV